MTPRENNPLTGEGAFARPAYGAPARSGGLGTGVAAILAELAARLELLAAHGDRALIDLHSMPMSPADRIELQDALGQGEVRALLDAQGESTLYETAYAGVWWIVHRDREGEVTSELLEVTLTPRILAAHAQDLAPASAAPRLRIVAPGTARSAAAGGGPLKKFGENFHAKGDKLP